MTKEQQLDPAVAKLLDYAKSRKELTWEEINEILTPEVVNSDKMDEILIILEKNKISIQEEDTLDEEDDEDGVEEQEEDSRRKQLIFNEKDTGSDDPIRMYLREIGKERLLTAEQEVILSKKMETGENIIKDVIKNSGMMIPEFFAVAQKAFSKIDPAESGKQRKELQEEMTERKRLRTCYSEVLKQVLPDMKQYIILKKSLFEADQTVNIFEDERLLALRAKILPSLQQMDIQSEEIEKFSNRFIDATKKIAEYKHKREKKSKRT